VHVLCIQFDVGNVITRIYFVIVAQAQIQLGKLIPAYELRASSGVSGGAFMIRVVIQPPTNVMPMMVLMMVFIVLPPE
jgi:hypothetical protein